MASPEPYFPQVVEEEKSIKTEKKKMKHESSVTGVEDYDVDFYDPELIDKMDNR